MSKKLTILCMTLMLLTACILSACAKSPINETVPDDGQNGNIAAPTEDDPGNAGNEPDDGAMNPDDATEPEDEREADDAGAMEDENGEPVQAEPLYYMNGIYDIKPIGEGTNERVVLLTFDDGPKNLELVSGLLDTLEKHNAKAIFFVNGYRVKANPDLLKMIYEKGHAIGNHSYDHINLRQESEEKIRQQVDAVQEIVEQTIGIRPTFFRPPNGASNDFLRNYVKEQGMLFMTWSNGSLDWDSKNQTPEAVIRNVLDQLRPGSNILMHELPWTVEALDELLTRLEEEGYSFVDPHTIRIDSPETNGNAAS